MRRARRGPARLTPRARTRPAAAEQLLAVHGRNELEERHTSKLLIFLKLVRELAGLRSAGSLGPGLAAGRRWAPWSKPVRPSAAPAAPCQSRQRPGPAGA